MLNNKSILWQILSILLVLLSVIFLVAGIIMVLSAEHERLNGWRLSKCLITRNFALNHTQTSSVCIYFSVTYDSEQACAVPAVLTHHGIFTDPPACTDLTRREEIDVITWRRFGTTHVECFVPTTTPIHPDQCVSAATTGGIGATVWRAWIKRFVYLVQTPEQGLAALASATSVKRNSGILFIVLGGFAFVGGIIIMCRSSLRQITRYRPSRLAQRYRTARSRDYKLS